ncbi:MULTISPECIES: FAD-dependent oxidoreductase [unclassified Paenibacillus]|uniref:FAD-dependent oxidoreductase n=1 Tax=unclassified Paenibacillus TaxID=185978 RepID=UPI002404D37F|nr:MULTISPECIES: FAD-dependent oxidoreductase [unclassified Paenibacillus]MDF9840049.1 NADPH-dependent 2,4-dienoyl-CoA reductase/sulfur reductase-like enzyme [Paenibacillus sp. PastF-2]MDF9846631.1 NADPH-dependent 2,4-dienoyl-CoA reductase/sulfur reductase-like enzyme [Paenibacillus sp. PastM-2]MDF9853021.1 NADPH-dependent 2,4-dienoyl-CoA reductase/sulfur reductase-like enzyme [Paenibacillus sp. PastF-1]MDH6478475.1 NADPH-dependent 2,4-dienoyl-CoA reductase/sulfur reductase-like enzyme [Paeniba
MKVAVIGCTHAGTAAIVNTAQLYPDAEITVYERNDNISFLSCGIALYVGGVVKDPQGLFYSSPEKLAELGVTTKMRHEVIHVNTAAKTLRARNLATGEEFNDTYDKLIMTTGSWPIIPKLEGMDLDGILLSKNYNHSNTIIERAEQVKRITVVGAGYIGVELVEAFQMNGKQVTLIDGEERILSKYLDEEFTAPIQKSLEDHGIKLALGEKVSSFAGENGKVTKVITSKGEHETDLVILCIGFRPNTELLKGQVDMLPNGAIMVNDYMQTSLPDVFAAGDSCAIHYNPTGQHAYIPLATNAVRMGTLVARNLVESTIPYMGTQGTSGIKIYEDNIAGTGLTEEAAKAEGIEVESVMITDNYRPEFMPTVEEVQLKVVYARGTRRILGAQIMSKMDLTQSINTVSVCIQNRMTVDQLAFIDFFFQPHYNKPWNFLNTAGLQALPKTVERKETVNV